MDKKFLFLGLTTCVFSVSAIAVPSDLIEKTTDMGNCYNIHTQLMKGLNLEKDKSQIYYKLSKISFTNHIMYQKYLIQQGMMDEGEFSEYKKDQAVRDAWCLNSRYSSSLHNVLSDIVASVLTNRDAQKMETIETNGGKFKIVKGKHIEDLTVAELNYTILYNYVDKHLLKLVDNDEIMPSLPKDDFKKYWYHWDDKNAEKDICTEAQLLMVYFNEKYADKNNDIHENSEDKNYNDKYIWLMSRIQKAGHDCVRYLYASQLNKYITIQNVLTYKTRQSNGIFDGFGGIANYKYTPKKNDDEFMLLKDSRYKINLATIKYHDVNRDHDVKSMGAIVGSIEGDDEEIEELLNGASFIEQLDGVKSLKGKAYTTPYATITQLAEHEKDKQFQGQELDKSSQYIMNIIVGRGLRNVLARKSPDHNYFVGQKEKDGIYDFYVDSDRFEWNTHLVKLELNGNTVWQLNKMDGDKVLYSGYINPEEAQQITNEYLKRELQKGDIANKEYLDIDHLASSVGMYAKSITNKNGKVNPFGLIEYHCVFDKMCNNVATNEIELRDDAEERKTFNEIYIKQIESALKKVSKHRKDLSN